MTPPEELKRNEPLKWSSGTGTDVWELFCACIRGDLDAVRRLLRKDPSLRDEDICSTPLGWAAKFGQRALVELLLQRGAKPNLPDDPPWATPLRVA